MEWLENDPEDCPDDKDVWGADMVKSNYNFTDLEKFYKGLEKKKGKWAELNESGEGSTSKVEVVKDKKKKKKQVK